MVANQLEEFCKEFGRGRVGIKRTKDGLPTAPRIYGRHKKYHTVPKSISLETVPAGVLPMWRSAYNSLTPPIQREFLCLSEAIRSLKLCNVEDRLEVIPICFFEVYTS